MKQIKLVLFIMVSANIFSYAACFERDDITNDTTAEVSSLLVKKWEFAPEQVGKVVDEIIENARKNSPEQARQFEAQRAGITQLIKATTLEYFADSTYQFLIPNMQDEKGTWSVEGKTVTLIPNEGDVKVHEIMTLNEDTFIYRRSDGTPIHYIAVAK